MDLKGTCSKLSYLDGKYTLKIVGLEQYQGMISGTAKGTFLITADGPEDDQDFFGKTVATPYTLNYEEVGPEQEHTKYTLRLVDMELENGLGQVSYTFLAETTNKLVYRAVFTAEKGFDTTFRLGNFYSFKWSEDN